MHGEKRVKKRRGTRSKVSGMADSDLCQGSRFKGADNDDIVLCPPLFLALVFTSIQSSSSCLSVSVSSSHLCNGAGTRCLERGKVDGLITGLALGVERHFHAKRAPASQ